MEEREQTLFVTCSISTTTTWIYVCAEAAEHLRDSVSVLAGGGLAALVNDPRGKLRPRVQQAHTRAVKLFAGGLREFLISYLNVSPGQRIPVFYDPQLDGLVLGAAERPRAAWRKKLAPAYPEQTRRAEFRADQSQLVLETRLPARSHALIWGDMLALHRDGSGQVTAERAGKRKVIRRPDVMEFCRDHWRGRQVYVRSMGRDTVLSCDPVALALLGDVKKFRPLRAGGTAAIDLRRDRSILLNPEAAKLLQGRLAAYVCGPTVALINDPAGDVEAEPEAGGAVIHSIRLYWQISRSYPLSNRLYLHSRGNLLVLSQDRDDVLLPPERDFCRLITDNHPFPNARLATGG